jgi:signal transduction histidine kinase
MSAVELTGAVRRRVSDRAWQLTGAAGLAQLGVLAVALDGGARLLVYGLGVLAVLIAGYVLIPKALAAIRRNRGWFVFGVAVIAVAVWVEQWLARSAAARPDTFVSSPLRVWGLPLPSLLVTALLAAAGMVLIADAMRMWLGLAPRQRAPWKQMTETADQPGAVAPRAIVGVLLVGWAAFVAASLAEQHFRHRPNMQVVSLLLIAVATAVVLGTPVAIGSMMRVEGDKAGSAEERERQRFAAHLHDSVLQTLALVQRQAHDPVAVARLARRQEHALRAWMAGEAELVSDTLVAALRDAIASVEDESGITVEFTAIGDRSLDSAGEELVAAAREALRNAARHAVGAPVFVFCQVSAGEVEVFVRDEGPGFDPALVPPERRGIRDAIVGRMSFAGGRATVDSVLGEGTEVAIRLCGRKAGK